MGRFRDGGHFCVALYRANAGAEDAFLRPFALPGSPGKPIAAEAFLGAVRQVIKIDRERHPDWFAPGDG